MPWYSVLKKNAPCAYSLLPVWCLRFGIAPFPESPSHYAEQLRELGLAAGLHRFGVAPAEPLLRARGALNDRISRGLNDSMQFTFRNPIRSTTPTMSVAGARSIIVGARSYFSDVEPLDIQQRGDKSNVVFADVARYAWADHYKPLRESLKVVVKKLRKDGHKAVMFADDNAIVDREAAYLAGLGWYGKNANLLIDGAGSWFVLGSIITTAELPAAVPVADGCGSCRRCINECPTGAIIEPGVIDARLCLAWVIQKPGIIPLQFREAIGSRIYGCDDCQDSCPPSMRLAQKEPVSSEAQMSVDVLALLSMTDDEVINNYGRWYIHNREVRWVRRNALVVLGNCATANNALAQLTIARYLADPDPHLRVHAIWASRRLGMSVDSMTNDPDPMVQHELSLFTAPRR